MTRKQFYKKRRHLIFLMMTDNKNKGLGYSFKLLDKMDRPRTKTYAEAWECMKPLRDIYNM